MDIDANIFYETINISCRSTSVARMLPPVTRSEVTRAFRSSSCAPVDRGGAAYSHRGSRLERWVGGLESKGLRRHKS